MRILQIVPSLIRGGAERLVLNLTDYLEKHGHEVEIFVFHDDNLYRSLNSRTTIRILPARVSYSLLGNDTLDTDSFDAAVRDFNPDVVHSHLIEAEFISRSNPYGDTAYISHWHGCPELLRRPTLSDFLKKDTYWNLNSKRKLTEQYRRCNNHFLCISSFMRQFLMDNLGVNESDCTIINNAVDTGLFKPAEADSASEVFRLIAVGKLNRNKNQQFLVRLIAELVGRGANTDLTLLGSGAEEPALKRLSAELGVAERIHFPGTVDHPEKYLQESDLLAHASDYEAFGLVLIEAMACGRPVVCFNAGGPAEIVQNGRNGFLIEKGNLGIFTEKVLKLINDASLYKRMSANALRFSRQYGLEQYGKKVVGLYERLSEARNT